MTNNSPSKKERNRKASERYRNKKKKELEELERKVKFWKGKCKVNTTSSEEQTLSKPTSKAKDIKSKNKKYGKRYKSKKQMTKEQKSVWCKKQRNQRNKIAATKSYDKKKTRLEELKTKLEYWKGEYAIQMKGKDHLEKSNTFPSKSMNNVSSCTSTGVGHCKVSHFGRVVSCNAISIRPEVKLNYSFGLPATLSHTKQTLSQSKVNLINEEVHSFAIRNDQHSSVPITSEEFENIFSEKSISTSFISSNNVCTEQPWQHITSSVTRMYHYNPTNEKLSDQKVDKHITPNPTNQESLDQRTDKECDAALEWKISQIRKDMGSLHLYMMPCITLEMLNTTGAAIKR